MAVLKASRRDEIGTRRVKPLRRRGLIPAVVYGHGEQPVAITLSQHDVGVAVAHGERLLEMELDGAMQNVLLKEVQYDPMGQEILHVDLTRVDLDETVKVTVPIVLRGTPVGQADGGVLHQINSQVTIECTVRSIPEDIRASVAEMKLDDVLYMKDLSLPEGAKLMDDGGAIVAIVSLVAEEKVAEPEEVAAAAPAEPEVIGEKKELEEGEEKQTEKGA